jgi:hypothetical protein
MQSLTPPHNLSPLQNSNTESKNAKKNAWSNQESIWPEDIQPTDG